jgi:hypothetical protein
MPRIKATVPAAPTRVAQAAPPAAARAASPSRAATPAPAKRTDGAKPAARPAAGPSADLRGKIIADAIRLLKWGKSWHELPELIERIAERPSATEIRKVLRANRADIEAKASQ